MFPYRNQSVDLLCKSTDLFLYDGNIDPYRVKSVIYFLSILFNFLNLNFKLVWASKY